MHPPSEIKSNFKFKTLRWRPLALFRSLRNKRQFSRKNKFDKLSGMVPALFFCCILSPKLCIMQGFRAQTHFFSEGTGPQQFERTKKKCPTDLRKLLTPFLLTPLQRDFSWWTFRPRKKIFSPPPPKSPNSPQTPSRPLGPSWKPPPPSPGIFNKNGPPPSWCLGLPLPPSRAEKKKNKKYPKRPPSFKQC